MSCPLLATSLCPDLPAWNLSGLGWARVLSCPRAAEGPRAVRAPGGRACPRARKERRGPGAVRPALGAANPVLAPQRPRHSRSHRATRSVEPAHPAAGRPARCLPSGCPQLGLPHSPGHWPRTPRQALCEQRAGRGCWAPRPRGAGHLGEGAFKRWDTRVSSPAGAGAHETRRARGARPG